MIRRTFNLMAGGALLAALLMGASPASAQARKSSSRSPAFRRSFR